MSTTLLAGLFYLATFAAGTFSMLVRTPIGVAVGLVAGACYIVVTILFYKLFEPVSGRISLLAAAISFAGIVAGPLRLTAVNPLVFFGCYCLLIGYLCLRSTFVPRVVGGLMVVAGAGWLTFLSRQLGQALYPYNMAPGMVGEGAMTVWLLLAKPVVNRRSRA
jgi:hypothetical protein